MSKYFVIIISFLFAMPVIGQNHYILNNFTTFKDQNRVILNWEIKRGSSCIGIGILRSTDNLNYEVIGEIRGVCGSTEFAQRYSFIDENPVKNSKNYYKLELGFSGRTEPPLEVTFIDVSEEGFKITPNPFSTVAKLYFANDQSNRFKLNIYNNIGQFCMTLHTSNNFFEMDKSNIDVANNMRNNGNSQLYFFEILNDVGEVISMGKFMTIQ